MPTVGDQRFAQALARWLDYHESTALEVLQDLMPVLPVLDPASPELLLSRGERRYASLATSGPVAGQFSGVIFFNPLSSGALAVIEKVRPLCLTAAPAMAISWRSRRPGAIGANPAAGLAVDGRATGPSVVTLSTETAAVPTGVFVWNGTALPIPPAGGAFDEWPGSWVLAPGDALAVHGETANQTLVVEAVWRERSASASELQRW